MHASPGNQTWQLEFSTTKHEGLSGKIIELDGGFSICLITRGSHEYSMIIPSVSLQNHIKPYYSTILSHILSSFFQIHPFFVVSITKKSRRTPSSTRGKISEGSPGASALCVRGAQSAGNYGISWDSVGINWKINSDI